MAFPSTSGLPQSASIVSRYYLNEASGNAVDAVSALTLTDNNSVGASTDIPAQGFGRSRDFELSNSQYFSRADATEHDLTGSFTLAMWIKPESQTGSHRLFTKMDQVTGTNRNYITQLDGSGNFDFAVWDTSDVQKTLSTTGGTAIVTGVWQLIVCVYEASTRMTIYKNGVEVIETTSSVPASLKNSSSGLVIGSTSNGALAFYDGLIQDAIMWKGAALSDAQVLALYNLYLNDTSGMPIFFT